MRSFEVTPRSLYVRRREFLKLGAGSALALSLPAFARAKVEHGPSAIRTIAPGEGSW